MVRRILITLLFGTVSTLVFAQQPTTTSSSTAFDNWALACATQTGKDNKAVKSCNVRTSFVTQNEETKQQIVAAAVMFVRQMSDKTPEAIVQLPLSSLLNVAPRLLDGEGKSIAELSWVGCQPQLCAATVRLTDAQIASLKKLGETLAISYHNQLNQDIRVNGSTKGLAAALDTLAKEK